MKLNLLAAALAAALAACSGTHTVKVEPVEIKPIHMTLDINVKVDRELDKFFDFEDEVAPGEETPPETKQPDEPEPEAEPSEPEEDPS